MEEIVDFTATVIAFMHDAKNRMDASDKRIAELESEISALKPKDKGESKE